MRICKLASVLAMAGLVAAVPFSAASADGPVVTRHVHDAGVDVVADCGSFQILDVFDADYTFIDFLDENGTLITGIVQYGGTDTFTNSVTGTAYSGSFHNTGHFDRPTRVGVVTGIVFRLTIRGVGPVLLDVGRLVFDHGQLTFEAGPHQWIDGDVAALCAALA
jgi:hypothetical protein